MQIKNDEQNIAFDAREHICIMFWFSSGRQKQVHNFLHFASNVVKECKCRKASFLCYLVCTWGKRRAGIMIIQHISVISWLFKWILSLQKQLEQLNRSKFCCSLMVKKLWCFTTNNILRWLWLIKALRLRAQLSMELDCGYEVIARSSAQKPFTCIYITKLAVYFSRKMSQQTPLICMKTSLLV